MLQTIGHLALCVLLLSSLGTAAAENESVTQLQLLAERGDAEAQNNLGLIHYTDEGVPQDFIEAMKWFRKAAEQHHEMAQFNLGLMYAYGEGVPQDFVEAVKWFRRAADQRLPDAQFNLGFMYANAIGVQQDSVEAVKWFPHGRRTRPHQCAIQSGVHV